VETYIANSVVINIDAILEQALCTRLSGNGSRAVADLVGIGLYDEDLIEGENTVVFAVLAPGGDGDGGGG
jgi:hypothetical protein